MRARPNVPRTRDVRTSLTVILGSAGLLQEFHRALGPEEIELLAAGIMEAALRLNQMAGRLVDAEGERPSSPPPRRPQCGSGPSSSGDVRSAAKEAAFRAGRLADLRLDLQDVSVRVPIMLLRKVVSEIVQNAFDISDRGAMVRVLLRADGLGSRLEIAGGERKGKGDRGRRPLAAARRIAEATGGALEVDRRVAGGTIVRVRWREAGEPDPVRIRIPYDNRA
jgi:signal transduction histidine kinase